MATSINNVMSRARTGSFSLPDCTCDGKVPYCPPCLLHYAFMLRIAHPDSLSIALLRRRIPRLTGREAWILLEATKRVRP